MPSTAEFRSASHRSPATDSFEISEVPHFPVRKSPNHVRYCSGSDLSRPRSASYWASCSAVTRGFERNATVGSVEARVTQNTRMLDRNRTGIENSSRRITYRPI